MQKAQARHASKAWIVYVDVRTWAILVCIWACNGLYIFQPEVFVQAAINRLGEGSKPRWNGFNQRQSGFGLCLGIAVMGMCVHGMGLK